MSVGPPPCPRGSTDKSPAKWIIINGLLHFRFCCLGLPSMAWPRATMEALLQQSIARNSFIANFCAQYCRRFCWNRNWIDFGWNNELKKQSCGMRRISSSNEQRGPSRPSSHVWPIEPKICGRFNDNDWISFNLVWCVISSITARLCWLVWHLMTAVMSNRGQ